MRVSCGTSTEILPSPFSLPSLSLIVLFVLYCNDKNLMEKGLIIPQGRGSERSSEVNWCQIKPSCMSDWPAMLLWGVLKPWGTISPALSQSGSVLWNRCPFCDPFSPPEPRPAVAGATPLPISHSGDPRARPHPLEFSSTVKGNRVSDCVGFHGHMVDIFHLNTRTAAIPRVVMMWLF